MSATGRDEERSDIRGADGARDGGATMTPVGEAYEETVEGDERLRVQVLDAGDGRFAYLAQCGYQACDGPFRDRVTSVETFADADAALEAGIVKARQLAGIDVPEA
jgi:hypothetical protein